MGVTCPKLHNIDVINNTTAEVLFIEKDDSFFK